MSPLANYDILLLVLDCSQSSGEFSNFTFNGCNNVRCIGLKSDMEHDRVRNNETIFWNIYDTVHIETKARFY